MLLAKISQLNEVGSGIYYRSSCRNAYMKSNKRRCFKTPNDLDKCTSKNALHSMIDYSEDAVILDNRPELLNSIYTQYLNICEESEETPVSSAQYLLKVLMKHFGNRLQMQTPPTK